MATITGSGPNSLTTLKEIHAGTRSWQVDTATTHSQIKLLQEALTGKGYNTQGADGIYGNNTGNAVRNFQSANGLTSDGYFGKNSLLKLEQILNRHLDMSDPDCGGGGGSTPSGDWGTGTVTGGALNCRKQPNTSASTWGQFPTGTEIPIKVYDDTWYETYWNGNPSQVGYVMRSYVTNVNFGGGDTPASGWGSGTVTGGGLNCRKQPNTTAATWGQFPNGTQIPLKAHDNTWYQTYWQQESQIGYVMSQYVTNVNLDGGSGGGNVPGGTLSEGMQGTAVTTLQQRLTTLRYYCGNIDGHFGRKTTLAVKHFQERNSLSIDGIVSTNTINKLNSSTAAMGVDASIVSWTANQKPVQYYQNSGWWSSYPYDAANTSGIETLGDAACGPTAMAMVVSTLLKKAVIPPILSDWALSNNYRDPAGQTGTYFSFFNACATAFGLAHGNALSAQTTSTFTTIQQWCNNGGLAVVNVFSKSPYTNSGHYVVIYKVANNYVYVNDPNYSNRNKPNYTISEWLSGGWFGNIALIKNT